MLPEGIIGYDQSGACEKLGPQDRRWFWGLGLVTALLIVSLLWGAEIYQWLSDPDRAKLVASTLVLGIFVWHLVGWVLGQKPTSYIGKRVQARSRHTRPGDGS